MQTKIHPSKYNISFENRQRAFIRAGTFIRINKIFSSFTLKLISVSLYTAVTVDWLGRVAQLVGHLTRKSEVLGFLGSIPGLATYFRFSFRFFKKGSCQLLGKVCARSTG